MTTGVEIGDDLGVARLGEYVAAVSCHIRYEGMDNQAVFRLPFGKRRQKRVRIRQILLVGETG